MSDKLPDWWAGNLAQAAAILHDRTIRRRVMMRFVVVLLGMFAAGLWLVDDWLMASPWRFVIWWGSCGLLAVFVLLFAVYDILAVIREERNRFQTRMREDFSKSQDSPCDDDD